MRTMILAATGLVALATSSAHATPMLYAMVFDNGVQVGATVSSANGILTFSGSDASFTSVTLSAFGVPAVPSPDLASQTTRISTASGMSSMHTLTIAITQVGLTTPLGLINFASTFTSNFLINGADVIANSIANYLDASDRGFAETTLLASASCSAVGSGTCSTPAINAVEHLKAPYSETQVFTASFKAGGSTVQASSQIVGTAVPEPASIAMFGMGLLGLGMLKRRLRG